jgi:hypothetical protein
VTQRRKARDVPDLAVIGIEVVGGQFPLAELKAAARAAVVVLAKTMHTHQLPREDRVGVEALPSPFTASGAANQTRWDTVAITSCQKPGFFR